MLLQLDLMRSLCGKNPAEASAEYRKLKIKYIIKI